MRAGAQRIIYERALLPAPHLGRRVTPHGEDPARRVRSLQLTTQTKNENHPLIYLRPHPAHIRLSGFRRRTPRPQPRTFGRHRRAAGGRRARPGDCRAGGSRASRLTAGRQGHPAGENFNPKSEGRIIDHGGHEGHEEKNFMHFMDFMVDYLGFGIQPVSKPMAAMRPGRARRHNVISVFHPCFQRSHFCRQRNGTGSLHILWFPPNENRPAEFPWPSPACAPLPTAR